MKIVLIHGQNHKGSSYHIGRIIGSYEKRAPLCKDCLEELKKHIAYRKNLNT